MARALEEVPESTFSNIITLQNRTSTVRHLTYVYSSNISFYDLAFESLGNPGWNWDLLKKYQKKSERFIPPAVKEETMSYDLAEHGTDGNFTKFLYAFVLEIHCEPGPLITAYVTTPSGLETPYHNVSCLPPIISHWQN